jgi:hypothetical protein
MENSGFEASLNGLNDLLLATITVSTPVNYDNVVDADFEEVKSDKK